MFQLFPLPLVLRRVCLLSLLPQYSFIYTSWFDSSEPSLLEVEQPVLLASPCIRCSRPLIAFMTPLLDSLQYVRASLVPWSPEVDTSLQMWSHQCWVNPLSSQLAPGLLQGLFLARCRSLHFSLLNFMRFLLAHFSILCTFIGWLLKFFPKAVVEPRNLNEFQKAHRKQMESLAPNHNTDQYQTWKVHCLDWSIYGEIYEAGVYMGREIFCLTRSLYSFPKSSCYWALPGVEGCFHLAPVSNSGFYIWCTRFKPKVLTILFPNYIVFNAVLGL